MLNAKQFAARLDTIKKTDEKFRLVVSEALAFAIYHARNHGQKTPFINLQEACPGWLQKGLSKVALSKKKTTEQECEMEAEFRVSEWFATHEQQKAIRAANRKAKAASVPTNDPVTTDDSPEADEPEIIVAEYEVLVSDELVVNGQAIALTPSEADALAGYLATLRMPALKVA